MTNLPGRNLSLPAQRPVPSPDEFFNVRNPLRKYRSYSYRWVITAHASTEAAVEGLTPDQRQNLKIGDTIGPADAPTGIVVVNEFSDVRCSVKEITWESISVGASDATTAFVSGTLGLFEPHGVNILAKMHSWVETLGVNLILQMVFAARVYFIGHTHDNTDEMLTGYPDPDRALIFFLDDLSMGFTLEGVSYNGSFTMAVNGNLADGAYAPLAALAASRAARAAATENADDEYRDSIAERIYQAIIDEGTPALGPPIDAVVGASAIESARAMYRRIRDGYLQPTTMTARTGVSNFTRVDIRSPIEYKLPVSPLKGGPQEPPKEPREWYDFTPHTVQTEYEATVTVECRVVDGSSVATITDSEYNACSDKFAREVAAAHVLLFTEASRDIREQETGLTDADIERQEAALQREAVLTGGPKTVREGLHQLQTMLNVTSVALAAETASSNGQSSALKYIYQIHCDETIADYKLDNAAPKTGGTVEGDSAESEGSADTTPDAISFRPQDRVHDMIKHILSYSTEIARQTSLIEDALGIPRRKESNKVVRIRTLRQDAGASAPTIIHFFVGLADSAVPRDPAALSDRAVATTELEFDYMYSNRYSDVLAFEMSLDAYMLAVQGYLTAPTSNRPATGDATHTYRITQSDPTAGQDRFRIPATVRPGSPFAEVRAYPKEAQQFLYSLSTAAMLSQDCGCSFTIMGDPFLCYDTMGDVSTYLKIASGELPFNTDQLIAEHDIRRRGHYFFDHHNDPVRVTLNIKYPVYDDRLQNFDVVPFWYGGYYHLFSVTNTFNDQGFTQTLDTLFPYNAAGLGQPPQPTPTPSDRP